MPPRIITDNRTLFADYQSLQAGDIVIGRVRLRPGEESLLVDLLSRGVHFIPSALSQLCSRSKTLQVRLLGEYMGPGTSVAYDLHDMQRLVGEFDEETPVVCKLDRANAGTGILRFSSIEDVYAQAVLGALGFPFVIQPFYQDCRDIRVVVLGDTIEAYERHNPNNFRHNLHFGGASRPWNLSERQHVLCRQIMERAGFPYAHIDFLITPSDETRLTEINLRGGLKGASLTQADYLQQVESVHEQLVAELTGDGETD